MLADRLAIARYLGKDGDADRECGRYPEDREPVGPVPDVPAAERES